MRTRTSRRPAQARRAPRHVPREAAARPARSGTDRVREAGGPQDRAFYRCECGYAFEGAVSTRVPCPHCGTDQAW